MESVDLIPMDGDVSKITRRADEFKDLPEAIQRNLQTFLTLTMDALADVHQKVKNSVTTDATKQMVRIFIRFTLLLSANRTFVDVGCTPKEVEVAHDVCWDPQVPYVTGRLLVSCKIRRRDCSVIGGALYNVVVIALWGDIYLVVSGVFHFIL